MDSSNVWRGRIIVGEGGDVSIILWLRRIDGRDDACEKNKMRYEILTGSFYILSS